jgi:hypothetical protein
MTNGDLISRSALKKAFEDTVCIEPMPYAFVKQIIDNAPTVEIPNYSGQVVPDMLQGWRYEERPQGEWKPTNVHFGTCFLQGYECKCGRVVMQRENFCPECGADMRGKEV